MGFQRLVGRPFNLPRRGAPPGLGSRHTHRRRALRARRLLDGAFLAVPGTRRANKDSVDVIQEAGCLVTGAHPRCLMAEPGPRRAVSVYRDIKDYLARDFLHRDMDEYPIGLQAEVRRRAQ